MAELERLPAHPTQFAFRNPDRSAPEYLSALERRVWDALDLEPRHASSVVHSSGRLDALRRLADAGLVTIAAFTPSDAMHVLDRQQGWCVEAALYGARILATEERNARAARSAVSPQAICERTYEHVVCETGRVLLAAALANDPGLHARGRSWGELGNRLIEETVAGRRFSKLLDTTLGLARPLVAIGAPVGVYYPEVARRLGAQLHIPAHAAVCNAVGAVAGVVSQSVEILVNQPTFNVFRVHDPAGSRDYPDSAPALEHARRVSRDLALAAARRAGASDPHVETSVDEKLAQVGPGTGYLAQAVARSTATGRPVLAHREARISDKGI
jgi:N-methylhydantoinase A/oxoprolinase/acetone carboxylase beta subunit